MSEPAHRYLTAEDLYDLPLDDVRAELVRGDLVCEPPAGFEHGIGATEVGYYLRRYVEDHPIGVVCGAETGFVLFRNPDTVRAPDAAFVIRERAERVVEREKYFEGAPVLAAELVSPGDSRREVAERSRTTPATTGSLSPVRESARSDVAAGDLRHHVEI